MTNFLHRPFPLSEHPLRDRSYRLPTPPIEEFYSLLTDALDRRRTGIMAYGRSRMGKTTAIDYLVALLNSNHPKLPVIVLRCRYKRIPSETAFFSNFLHAVRHRATTGRDSEQLRQRLVQRLCEIADTKGTNQLVLFADEAQNLTRSEYEWLRDVHDDLHHWGKTLLVALVGQPDLKGEKTTFQRDGSMHIVSRFMVHELAFHGARNAEDCATCLQGYDQQEYPANSGWSHTRFAFPKAYAAGLRFANEGSAAWYAFDLAHQKTQLPQKLEIGMEFLTAAVEHLMLTNAIHDQPEFRPSIELWNQAVKASGYVEATLSEIPPDDR
jgi:hypothetical protein